MTRASQQAAPRSPTGQPGFGGLLRDWRERRRLSQLELAGRAGVSARHLSFMETGRSKPSREMVLHLAEHLDLPLRQRNHLLLAAGYAPVYSESSLQAPEMTSVRMAVRKIVAGHEPYPAVVVDRTWTLVEANASLSMFTAGCSPALLAPPANVYRLALHPDGLAARILNLGEWRAHLLGRLRRQITMTAEPSLVELYDEVSAYPCAQPEPELHLPGDNLLVPLRIRHEDTELAFVSVVATFGTPLDVTVAELCIESFFPADQTTAAALHTAWPSAESR